MSIKDFMAKDHKACDDLFAAAENAVSNNDWPTAAQAFDDFIQGMQRHLGVEEEELFPAFEQATGMTTGPTEMMRMEHDQMRGLFADIQQALAQQKQDDFLALAESLLILMQQHNMKEEQILYNLIDQHLSEDNDQWKQRYEHWGDCTCRTK